MAFGGERAPNTNKRTVRLNTLGLPLENLPDLVRLPFADRQLERIAQGDGPALAAQSAEFADMVYIHDCVSVYPLKLRLTQAAFDSAERLRGQQALFCRNDPNQFSLGLKCKHFIHIEENIVRSGAADDSPRLSRGGRSRCGGNLSHLVRDLDGTAEQYFGPFHGLLQARLAHGLQQVVDGAGLKGLNRMLVESCDDHDNWKRRTAQAADYFESAHDWHLQIKKHQVRFERCDPLQCFPAILGFADNCDVGQQFQFVAQELACDGFVIDDQGVNAARIHR